MKKIKLLYATPLLATAAVLPVALTSCGDSQKYIKCFGDKEVTATISSSTLTAKWSFELVTETTEDQEIQTNGFQVISGVTPSGSMSCEIGPQTHTTVWVTFEITDVGATPASGSFTIGIHFKCVNKKTSAEVWKETVKGLVVNYSR